MRALGRDFARAFLRFREHEGFRIAAAISFYVLLSAVPAVALMIASIGWVLEDAQEQAHILDHMFEILPLGSVHNRSFLLETVRVVRESSGGLTLLGGLGLVWAALGMVSAVRWGLNRAFSASKRTGLVRVKVLDLGVAFILWLLLLASAAGTAALHVLTGESQGWAAGAIESVSLLWGFAQWTIPALLTFAAFVFLYRYVPHVPHSYRDVIPAAVVAAMLFELTKVVFGVYMDYVTSHQRIYSALGGTFGFLLWVYVSAVTMLYGAEFSWSFRHRRAAAREAAAIKAAEHGSRKESRA